MGESHEISFENYYEYSMHNSFENLSDYGLENLIPKRFSQDNQTIEFSGRCHIFHDPIANYMEGFFNQEGHQEIDEDFKQDTSLCVLDPEVNFPGSIEEHNAAFFTTLLRNQVSSSEISHRKVDAAVKKYLGLFSHGFLERHLYMVLEE